MSTFELPNSGLTVTYSTKFFDWGEPGLMAPDVVSELTGADFFAGNDVTLQAALDLPAGGQ